MTVSIITKALVLIALSCVVGVSQTAEQLVEKAPTINGASYDSGNMIACVNALRRLGKERALVVLGNYASRNGGGVNPSHEQKLHLICRLLFVNRSGWVSPALGKPFPDLRSNAEANFPLFPLAISNGVPFLLIQGYQLGGTTDDTGTACLKRCENLKIIETDLGGDHKAAARDLLRSEAFKQLYQQADDMERMRRLIIKQAEPLPKNGERSGD